MPGSSKSSKRSTEKSYPPPPSEDNGSPNRPLSRTNHATIGRSRVVAKRSAPPAALVPDRKRSKAAAPAETDNLFAQFMPSVVATPQRSPPGPSKDKKTAEDEDSKLKRKEPLLNIILNQIFWSFSREPSPVAMRRLYDILASAKKHGLLLDEHDKLSLKMIQAWFRSKRFHVRRSLTDYCTKMQKAKRINTTVQFLKALESSFDIPYLLGEHKVESRLGLVTHDEENEDEDVSDGTDNEEDGDDQEEEEDAEMDEVEH